MLRFTVALLGGLLVACSATHECTPGESRSCDGGCNARQFCNPEQRWSECYSPLTLCDADFRDGSVGNVPDARGRDVSVADMDANADITDTDPFPRDVFSPGACTWSMGPIQRLTRDAPGGKLLSALSLGRGGVHFAWASTADRNLRVQEIAFDASPLLAAQLVVPPPDGFDIAYGSVAEGATSRVAVVGSTRGSIVVPLRDDDTVAGPLGPPYGGRCIDVDARSDDTFSMLCLPADGSPGVTYRVVDAAGVTELASTMLRTDAIEAHRTTLHGGTLDGHFLLLAQDTASVVTAQHFDASGVAVAEAVRLPSGAGTLRGAGAVAIDGGWLVALQVGAFELATSTLDIDGRPTREPYHLPDVRSTRGLYYGLATTSSDAMVVWTEWIDLAANDIALHAQPLSHDGFPRGPVIDVGRFHAAGSAPDVIEALGTPSGVVVVFHTVMDAAPADPEIYSALLSCSTP